MEISERDGLLSAARDITPAYQAAVVIGINERGEASLHLVGNVERACFMSKALDVFISRVISNGGFREQK